MSFPKRSKKIINLEDAVKNINKGDTIAIGGFAIYQRPMAFVREIIKQKAVELLGQVKTEDAYMYEDKEGVRIIFNDNIQDKIDILPHSLHIWYEFTEPVTEFCDWLLENVYLMKNDK